MVEYYCFCTMKEIKPIFFGGGAYVSSENHIFEDPAAHKIAIYVGLEPETSTISSKEFTHKEIVRKINRGEIKEFGPYK